MKTTVLMKVKHPASMNIAPERKALLESFISLLINHTESGKTLNLNFICTHNSRRSQLAEVLTFEICHALGLSHIESFSGGTESTAFNHRMVKALTDSGHDLKAISNGTNPHYTITAGDKTKECFSKKYDDPFNPQNDFIAITVCSDAEQNCPVVFGAKSRFHLPYLDPKAIDDTDQEETKYREKLEEINAELSYVFGQYKSRMVNG